MKNILMDMEKPTCNEVTVRFFMFCRVETVYDFEKKFFCKECDIERIQNMSSKNTPTWLRLKNELSRIYRNLIVIDIEDNQVTSLEEYLSQYSFLEDGRCLHEFLVKDELRQYIIYDMKTKSFMHTIELMLKLPLTYVENSTVSHVYTTENQKIDLYNCIRNGIVKVSDTKNSIFVEHSLVQVKNTVKDMIQKGYDLEVKEEYLYIPKHSGNITVSIRCAEDSEQVSQIADAFLALNKEAERLEYFNDILHLNGCTCSFNGRFHTVVVQNEHNQYHFVPITFQAQFVWSYLEIMSEAIENLNISLQDNKNEQLDEEDKQLISSMIEKIHIFSYDNEVFKKSIENEADLVYKKFEDAWNLDTLLEAIEKYINNLKDYLNRSYMEEENRKNTKQNKILFVISLFQILAVISVWADFLSIENTYGIPLFDLLGGKAFHVITAVNSGLPVALVVVSLILLGKAISDK